MTDKQKDWETKADFGEGVSAKDVLKALEEDWEKEFDERWGSPYDREYSYGELKQYIKDNFISKKKLERVIDGMYQTDETQMSEDHIYDQALDDIKSALLDKK